MRKIVASISIFAAVLVGGCGDGSSDYRPSRQDARLLSIADEVGGNELVAQYRGLLAC